MNIQRLKLLTIVLACGMVISGLLGAILYYVLPQFYPSWFQEMVIFFLLTEVLIVAFVDKKTEITTDKQKLNMYLMTKVFKIISSLIFITVYALTVKEGIRNFVLVFALFYLLFLFMETMIFAKIEKRLKNKPIE